MVKVRIGNSVCKLEGLSVDQFTELREILSYSPSASQMHYMGYGGIRKTYLLSKKCEFPTGLLYLVEEYLGDLCTKEDTRVLPVPHRQILPFNLGHTPYEEQIEACEASLRHSRGIIVAPTGVGKSVIIALIIHRLNVKTLVVVPSLELVKQLSSSLKDILGDTEQVTVLNVDNKRLLDKIKYDCVIIDEFHHSGAKTYRKMNESHWNNTYYKFGLTATPFRSQDNEKILLESVLSQVIYEIPYQVAITKKYIVPMEAYYIEIPNTKVSGTSWPAVYSQLIVNNTIRNKHIQDLLISFHTNNISTICLVKEIKHGDLISSDGAFNFINSETDERHLIDLFNNSKVKVLIGTDTILGEGIDTKPCEVVIIAGLGKSPNRFIQGCGRSFRNFPGKESCKVIIIKDLSHKWTKAHFVAQCKILKDYFGVTPTQLYI